jgi:hypothetical protein
MERFLRNRVVAVEAGLEAGLLRAGTVIREQSMKECPVDKGNLIGSAYGPIIRKEGKTTYAEIGYIASYAPFVHENVGASFKKPGAKAKFLEDPIFDNQDLVQQSVALFVGKALV